MPLAKAQRTPRVDRAGEGDPFPGDIDPPGRQGREGLPQTRLPRNPVEDILGSRMADDLEIVGEIGDIETIAVGNRIRDIRRLRRAYGAGRWRKRKGKASVRLPDGVLARAEIHWYETAGVGRKEFKIKRFIR